MKMEYMLIIKIIFGHKRLIVIDPRIGQTTNEIYVSR